MVYKKVKAALIVAGLAFCATGAVSASQGMTGASGAMLSHTCAGCHGTDGASVGPASPTISGLSSYYFIDVMEGFASGDVPSTIMDRIALGYSAEEIEAMAEFFAKKPFVPAKQEFDDSLVELGASLHDRHCERCHADGGTFADDDAGVLAGQWAPYLRWTLADYRAEYREGPARMHREMREMLEREGEKSMEALISYYASQQ